MSRLDGKPVKTLEKRNGAIMGLPVHCDAILETVCMHDAPADLDVGE